MKKEKGVSPVPKKEKALKVVADLGYEITLKFDHKAQLYDVAIPDKMTMEQTSEHLAVAQLWLAHEIVGKGGKKE